MRRHRVGRLPVTSPLTGRLAGIVTRSDLLRVYRRPGAEIRAEIETEVLPRVRGADPRRLAVSVRDGVVLISGRVEVRSAVARLASAVLAVEGVVGVDELVGFDLDDRYPPVPVTFLPPDTRSVRSRYGQAAFRSPACRETRPGRAHHGPFGPEEGGHRCDAPPHYGGPPPGKRVTRRRTS